LINLMDGDTEFPMEVVGLPPNAKEVGFNRDQDSSAIEAKDHFEVTLSVGDILPRLLELARVDYVAKFCTEPLHCNRALSS
jgi:hypothetical protein